MEFLKSIKESETILIIQLTSRYKRVSCSCEWPRMLKTRKTGNLQHARGFSEWYTVRGLNLWYPESKWRVESVKLRAHLSGPAQRIGY
jgi:hypothetical protein